MPREFNVASCWCEHHWSHVVWPRVQAGELVSLSLTMDLNASVFNSEQFHRFREGFDDEATAVDEFMRRYSPLCCLMSAESLQELLAANTPAALRQRRPKDAEDIIKQDRAARKRGVH